MIFEAAVRHGIRLRPYHRAAGSTSMFVIRKCSTDITI